MDYININNLLILILFNLKKPQLINVAMILWVHHCAGFKQKKSCSMLNFA